MTQAGFQRNNLDWQLQQLGRRINEWLEWQFRGVDDASLPNTTLAPWFLETLFWLLVSSIVIGLTWQLWIGLRPYLAKQRQRPRQGRRSPVSQTPVQVSLEEWLRRAQQYQHQGNYAQACRALYMAMLQRLQDRQRLPQQPGLTDGEFLQVVQTFSSPAPYQVLITTHEQVCFSDRPISAETLSRCQQAYQEISGE